jgi:hypothetical protein
MATVVLGELDGKKVVGFCTTVGGHDGPHVPLESLTAVQARMLNERSESVRPAA